MESLSRPPPHRRKHSSSASFSFKNPYDDVLLSNGGAHKAFGANDYKDIFSGPSSIPVLDLPGLDERVGLGEARKLDYSNIFGGLRNDDVAVPYEELFSRREKKAEQQRIPADVRPPSQEPDPQQSSGKTKRTSGEVFDHLADGVKKQFNMSFNKTSQINIDPSNGKTHIAQLHAVPGFTYFVDGSHSQKADEKPARSLKREVSRTWSFSAPVQEVKSKGGSSREKSELLDKSPEISSKTPPPQARASSLDHSKGPKHSRASSFFSHQDESEKNAGAFSPTFLEEELDENSVAAISAAALKKAIEQAEESIRLAKMIMKRKEEGLGDGSKPKSKGRSKVTDKKESRADREGYGSKEGTVKEKYKKSDPVLTAVTGFDRNSGPKPANGKKHIHAGKAVDERVRENVESAKEHGTPLIGVHEIFAPSFHSAEPIHRAAKVELKELRENVEASEVHKEATDIPEKVAHEECRTANIEPVEVEDKSKPVSLTNKFTSKFEEMEKIKEILEPEEVIIHQVKEPEVDAELVERATPQRKQELEESTIQGPEPTQATREPEISVEQVETVLHTSQDYPEHCLVDEKGEILCVLQLGELTKKKESVSDDERKHEQKSEEPPEVDEENFTLARSVFDDLLNEARGLVEKEEQEEVKVSEDVLMVQGLGKIRDQEGTALTQKEAQAQSCFESEVQPEEASKEESDEMEPENIPFIREVDSGATAIDDNKEKHVHDGDEPSVPGEMDHNEFGERLINASENKATETVEMKIANSAESQTNPIFWETDGSTSSTEDLNKYELPEVEIKENMEDGFDANTSDASTIFRETHSNDADFMFGENQETSGVGLNNRAEECQKVAECYFENISVPEADSAIDRGKETEGLFHFEDNEIPETGCLRRTASEETFSGIKLHNVFEGFPYDDKKEHPDVLDAGDRENLLKDEVDALKSNDGILDCGKIMADPSDTETAEIGLTDVRHVSEKGSENDHASVSSSSLESMDGLPADESQQSAENGNEQFSDKEEVKEQLQMPSQERVSIKEQSEAVYPEDRSGDMYSDLHSEPEKMEKSQETERAADTSQNVNEKENLTGNSMAEERDTKRSASNFDKNDRIEAIKRGREREKDRIAVERAIREARERAFAEARERAERAAVEKAAAEARQRMMAEAREKLEKANKQLADKHTTASVEARLRAERAAVERATAEARQRALEKARSQKTSTEVRTQGDRHPSERVSSSSRSNGLKHSFSSSDLEKLDDANTESAQRRKARLERHQRIMERAAKALEEKNMRDLRAQKEQAERNRLAESLDAEIKRWATGKEGNLRALLSTLQYILGPDSGWQPISLTEIITTAAVKKAYRKATLYVHPDKLQQRGASIQQKYICEKVFDLLKAAWNRFNSEER